MRDASINAALMGVFHLQGMGDEVKASDRVKMMNQAEEVVADGLVNTHAVKDRGEASTKARMMMDEVSKIPHDDERMGEK